MRRLKVYIASPYTKGDVAVNVRTSMEAWDKLYSAGFAPFAPLWSHFQHLVFPRPYEDWDVCDAMLRLPGESSGARSGGRKSRGNGHSGVHLVQGIVRVAKVTAQTRLISRRQCEARLAETCRKLLVIVSEDSKRYLRSVCLIEYELRTMERVACLRVVDA